jgi:hypothetical protein
VTNPDASAIGEDGPFAVRASAIVSNTPSIAQHIIIPKPKNAIAMLRKPLVACGVTQVCCMLAAINLNYQTLLATDEVGYVRTNWFLPY